MAKRGLRKLGLRLQQRSLGLVITSLRYADGCIGLIHLLHRNVLLLEKWLDALVVIGGEFEPSLCCRCRSLGAGYSSARCVDAASRSLNARL
jgi:hypothetical protein